MNEMDPSEIIKLRTRESRDSLKQVTTMDPSRVLEWRRFPYNELYPSGRDASGAQELRHEEDISGFHINDIVYNGYRSEVKVVGNSVTEPSLVPKSSSSSTTTTTTTSTTKRPKEEELSESNRTKEMPSEPRMVYSDVDVTNRPGVTYQRSVTMVAQMVPSIEAGPSNLIWGLPFLAWGIIIGCAVLTVLSVLTLCLCCWLFPGSRKILSPKKFSSLRSWYSERKESADEPLEDQRTPPPGREIIMAHSTSKKEEYVPAGGQYAHYVPPKPFNPNNAFIVAQQRMSSFGVRGQEAAAQQQPNRQRVQVTYQQQSHINQQQQQPPQNYLNYYRVGQGCSKHSTNCSSNEDPPGRNNGNHQVQKGGRQHIGGSSIVVAVSRPEIHKSMWSLNNSHGSSSGLSDMELAAYRTRSLPSWGKGNKQRPVSTADDLEELYAKVNFSKKRRNRMRNDEAAIIALCRSKSQNLSGLPMDRDGIVVYDERTAL